MGVPLERRGLSMCVDRPAGPAMLEGADALAPYAKKHFPAVAELPAWDGNRKNFQPTCRESRSYRHQKEIIFRLKILNIQVKPVFMIVHVGLARSWTVGWKRLIIAPEIHNVAFCTSNSVHELLSCGLWGETYGKKKVLQKGVLRLLCLRICLPSANPLTMLEAIRRIWNKEIQRYIICDQFAFHMRIGIDSIDSSTEQQNSNLCALRWQLYFSTPQCGNHQTIALREKFHFSFQFI